MSVLVLVSVYDKVAGFYQTPFFVPSKGVAARSFADEVNRADDKNPLHKHAADFDLYYLGLFDDNAAVWNLPDHPELILQGSNALSST